MKIGTPQIVEALGAAFDLAMHTDEPPETVLDTYVNKREWTTMSKKAGVEMIALMIVLFDEMSKKGMDVVAEDIGLISRTLDTMATVEGPIAKIGIANSILGGLSGQRAKTVYEAVSGIGKIGKLVQDNVAE